MQGSHHSVHGKFPGMCCHCGMCHITNPGVVPSSAKGGATILPKPPDSGDAHRLKRLLPFVGLAPLCGFSYIGNNLSEKT
jgi:hypothetical protein